MTDFPPAPVLSYANASAAPKKRRGIFTWIVLAVLAVMILLPLLRTNQGPSVTIPLSDFEHQLQAGQVKDVYIGENSLRGHFITPSLLTAAGGATSEFRVNGPQGAAANWNFIQWVLERNQRSNTAGRVEIDTSGNLLLRFVLPLIPWVLIVAFIYFFVFRNIRKAQAGGQRPIPVYQVPPPM